MKITFTQSIILAFAVFLLPLTAIAQSPSLSLNVEQAGTLEQLLGEDISTVETLILSGELNDVDVATMVNMSQTKQLKHIDISKIAIKDEYVIFHDALILSIVLPENMVNIAPYAFYGNPTLKTVILPQGLISIGESAFSYCEALEAITFPEGLKTIGDRAFDSCRGLTSVRLPASLGEITSSSIFSSCSSITSAILEEGITQTGNNLFWSCDLLESVSLPNSLIGIGGQAFYGCNSLLSITIPENVKTIGPYGFISAYNLRDVYCKNPLPPLLEGTFSGETKQEGTRYVPAGSSELYKAALEWEDFLQIQEEISTGVEEGQVNGSIVVVGGVGEVSISIKKAARTEIYTLTGVRVFASLLDESEHNLPPEAGVYIVKIGNTTHKVLVR